MGGSDPRSGAVGTSRSARPLPQRGSCRFRAPNRSPVTNRRPTDPTAPAASTRRRRSGSRRPAYGGPRPVPRSRSGRSLCHLADRAVTPTATLNDVRLELRRERPASTGLLNVRRSPYGTGTLPGAKPPRMDVRQTAAGPPVLAWQQARGSNGPTEAANTLTKRIRRVGFGFRKFRHYRLHVLLCADRLNRDRLATVAPGPSSRR